MAHFPVLLVCYWLHQHFCDQNSKRLPLTSGQVTIFGQHIVILLWKNGRRKEAEQVSTRIVTPSPWHVLLRVFTILSVWTSVSNVTSLARLGRKMTRLQR
jgi:hypothetical protein